MFVYLLNVTSLLINHTYNTHVPPESLSNKFLELLSRRHCDNNIDIANFFEENFVPIVPPTII